ncbi:hypothetical protein B7H23_07080 [Notoacmeibacter marinus]|uniref:Methyltransferase type 11 domain-containing protein n=1 Tax=Notoacmeibacter marinus TaxID=1876515 RepID=A0A231V382_9HYPH|nr:class I SAM-dependent methyltransferase [Notoacmeibacter marinus]OXT02643.1 hypothetical protein B7H23_07080 [Notoacmeibacter marinus]
MAELPAVGQGMDRLLDRLDSFTERLDRAALVDAVLRYRDMPRDRATLMIETYLGEMPTGARIVAPHLQPGQRILEVGSGIGVLSAFLLSEGFEVLGIEPGQDGGFSFMTALCQAVLDQIPADFRPDILPIGAEALTPAEHGTFDLIFSANVLEHIMALDAAIPAMRDVLKPDGLMRHLCPNYRFPYEPHLGVPLLPFAPQATRHLMPGKVAANHEIWSGVNFITAHRIARLARANGLSIAFDDSVMGAYMRRLNDDPIFARRHGGLLGAVARRPRLVEGLARLLDAVPSGWASPMTLTLRHS